MSELKPIRSIPTTFHVNGREVSASIEPRLHLADFLRDHLRLTGTHIGCEQGVCGACTVLLDNIPVRACITYAVACDGLNVRTIEGFEHDEGMALLRETFSREHGLQCGFCTPGMLITSRDILLRLPNATEKQVRVELSGNLCRCTGYKGIVEAVCAALKEGQPEEKRGPVAERLPVPAVTPVREFTTFTPDAVSLGSATAPTPQVSDTSTVSRKGWTHVEESFVISIPPDRVWRAFQDIPLLAACLPGAQLEEYDATSVKGCINVKLGPIAAAFSGAAAIERDDATMSGRIKGGGSDKRSGSRTRGELGYRLSAEDAGQATRVSATIDYSLQGMLAQFSRSGLAQEMGRILVAQFAANLNNTLGANGGVSVRQGDKDSAAAKPISAWHIFYRAFLNLFR